MGQESHCHWGLTASVRQAVSVWCAEVLVYLCWELSQTLVCVNCVRLCDSELKDERWRDLGPLAKKPSTHLPFPNVSKMIVSLRFVNNKVSGECGFLVCVGCCQGLCLRMSEQVGCKPWGHEMTPHLSK